MNMGCKVGVIGRLAALLFFLAASPVVSAQTLPPPAPPVDNSDENGIDVATGQFSLDQEQVSIGNVKDGGLTFGPANSGAGWYSSFRGTITYGSGGAATRRVAIGKHTENFTLVGSVYQSDEGSGSTLNYINFKYTYVMPDGTQAIFETPGSAQYHGTLPLSIITSMTEPSGFRRNFHYVYAAICPGTTGGGGGGGGGDGGGPNPSNRQAAPPSDGAEGSKEASVPPAFATFEGNDSSDGTTSLMTEGQCSQPIRYHVRLQSITSNSSYQIKLHYLVNQNLAFLNVDLIDSWNELKEAIGVNNAVEYCDPAANVCTFANSWPRKKYTGNYSQLTDELGAVTSYGGTGGVATITPPTSSTPLVSATCCSTSRS